jgi:uncharacterized membrane protein YedE/YeeE
METVREEARETSGSFLKDTVWEGFISVFRRQWPPWVGGLAMGFIVALMFAWGAPWGVTNGIIIWGDNLLKPLLYPGADLQSPLWQYVALINWSFLLGALISALIGGDFRLSIPGKDELFLGALGGTLMGIGAFMAFGCTIGAFLVGFGALGASAITMMIGHGIGAYLGLRIYMWLMLRGWGSPGKIIHVPEKLQLSLGLILLLVAILLIAFVDRKVSTFTPALGIGSIEVAAGSLIFFGVILGIINQRTRFCFVRAFRQPFETGESDMTRAAALAIAVAAIGGAIVKFSPFAGIIESQVVQETLAFEMTNPPTVKTMMIAPSFPFGSLIGGIIFGIGMTLAGGCSVGSMWRAGEGSVKNMVAILFYAIGGSLFAFVFRKIDPLVVGALSPIYEKLGANTALGTRVFLPDALNSLAWSLVILLGLAGAWYLFSIWNEKTGRFVLKFDI